MVVIWIVRLIVCCLCCLCLDLILLLGFGVLDCWVLIVSRLLCVDDEFVLLVLLFGVYTFWVLVCYLFWCC